MPQTKRDSVTEKIIIKSLHTYFHKSSQALKKEIDQARKKGLLFIAIGVVIIIAASYMLQLQKESFIFNSFRVVLEPAGWFFTWTGFESVFYSPRGKRNEHDFASRMAHAEIAFLSF